MLKPVLFAMQQANRQVERRKSVRDRTDFAFEAHRDICMKCYDKTFFQIKDPDHECDEGFKLAIIASKAHREVRGG